MAHLKIKYNYKKVMFNKTQGRKIRRKKIKKFINKKLTKVVNHLEKALKRPTREDKHM